MNYKEMREAIDAWRAAMPKVPVEKILLHDERSFTALAEFIDRHKSSPLLNGQVGDLLGVPIHFDEDVPHGTLRTCYQGGIAIDTPIR